MTSVVQEAQKEVLDEHAPAAKQRAKKFDLQSELKKLRSTVDIDHYELKPVPRYPENDAE